MRAEKITQALLNDEATHVAIVGTRCFGGYAGFQQPAPLTVYRKVPGTTRTPGLASDGSEATIVRAQVEVLCVATSYEQLKALSEAVRVAMANKLDSTVAGIHLLGTEIVEEGEDDFDETTEEHGMAWTFEVIHEE